MRSLLSSVSIKIAQSPKVLRYCIGPISWRLIIMIATVMGWIQVSNKHPHIKFPANGLDSMYYSICAAYGVIAGFLITAMMIVVISDSVSAVSMRKRAQDSVPYKIIFAIVTDRKSTRLNSSHVSISYAVFCLKKKKYVLWQNKK